jgi:hypothetical protein
MRWPPSSDHFFPKEQVLAVASAKDRVRQYGWDHYRQLLGIMASILVNAPPAGRRRRCRRANHMRIGDRPATPFVVRWTLEGSQDYHEVRAVPLFGARDRFHGEGR